MPIRFRVRESSDHIEAYPEMPLRAKDYAGLIDELALEVMPIRLRDWPRGFVINEPRTITTMRSPNGRRGMCYLPAARKIDKTRDVRRSTATTLALLRHYFFPAK
jgi:hypothetical protein